MSNKAYNVGVKLALMKNAGIREYLDRLREGTMQLYKGVRAGGRSMGRWNRHINKGNANPNIEFAFRDPALPPVAKVSLNDRAHTLAYYGAHAVRAHAKRMSPEVAKTMRNTAIGAGAAGAAGVGAAAGYGMGSEPKPTYSMGPLQWRGPSIGQMFNR